MERPDITPVQIKAILLWIFSALGLVGMQVAGTKQDEIITVVSGFFVTVLPVALVVADAVIRRARANNVEAILRNRSLYGQPSEPYVEGDQG